MPTVPTVNAPTVQQSGAPISIGAPASAFGANVIGEGLANLGQTLGVSADDMAKHAEQFQALNNKAEADGAFVQHLQDANAFAAKYQDTNKGLSAFTNLPGAMDTLNQQRDQISNGLSNPMARAMFDADSRRALANVTGELTRYATSQRREYILKQSVAKQEALASDTVIHPEQFDANMAQMMQQQVGLNEQLGLSPEQGELEARKLYGNTVSMVSMTLAGQGNITAATDFLEKHKGGMDGKVYADTLIKLKPAVMANDAASIGHNAVQDALHGLGSPVGPTVDYLSNVHGREGSGKNPLSSADGIGQFTKDTWLSTVKNDPQFKTDIAGKTDAEILAMRHDPSIANRAILSYGQSNASYLSSKGLPVNAATVGMAHGYGPGGAEALLHADPNAKVETVLGETIAKNNRVYGQTVAQVIGGFTSRFGGASTDSVAGGPPTSVELSSRMQTVLSLVDAQVQAQYGDNAVIRDQAEAKAMSELNRMVSAQKDVETNAYTSLGQVAQDSQIQDLPTLLKTVPNGLQMYNSLPLAQRTSLQADVHRNATEMTSSRFSNVTTLDGMYAARATNPDAFLNAPIAEMDLPLSQKLDFLKKQAEVRNKPASQVDPTQQAITHIQQSEQYKALTTSLGITPKSDEEFHLLGTVSGQLDAWNKSHPGQAPGYKDISAMLAYAAGQQKFHYEVAGVRVPFSGSTQNNFEISDEDRAQATKLLPRLGRPVDEYNIARLVAEKNARMGNK